MRSFLLSPSVLEWHVFFTVNVLYQKKFTTLRAVSVSSLQTLDLTYSLLTLFRPFVFYSLFSYLKLLCWFEHKSLQICRNYLSSPHSSTTKFEVERENFKEQYDGFNALQDAFKIRSKSIGENFCYAQCLEHINSLIASSPHTNTSRNRAQRFDAKLLTILRQLIAPFISEY